MPTIAELLQARPTGNDELVVPQTPECVFEGALLRNKSSVAVTRWEWGVLFRDRPNEPYSREGGAVSPGSEDFQNVGTKACAFRKAVRVFMANGSILGPAVSQLADNLCYQRIGWDIVPKSSATADKIELELLPLG